MRRHVASARLVHSSIRSATFDALFLRMGDDDGHVVLLAALGHLIY
jgi:hypothetical protein